MNFKQEDEYEAKEVHHRDLYYSSLNQPLSSYVVNIDSYRAINLNGIINWFKDITCQKFTFINHARSFYYALKIVPNSYEVLMINDWMHEFNKNYSFYWIEVSEMFKVCLNRILNYF